VNPRGRGAGRVIAGSARGIALRAPGEGTRPLGDRVKQALFAILEPEVRGGRFLDLFAGSGGGGIEALSRGAAEAVFVERDKGAIEVIEQNLVAAHLRDRARVVRADAIAWLAGPGRTSGTFAAVLADPPYEAGHDLGRTLQLIAEAGPDAILATDGVVVAKHASKAPPAPRIGLLRSVRERQFGDTTLTFYRWADEEDG